MPDVRVYFSKLGSLKYISHLDLQRAVARLLVRSGLPISYTEGFNPHPKLNIVLPLSVYQEGENEVFDFRLESDVPEDEIVGKLNAKMFPGSRIIKAEYLDKKTQPVAAIYRIVMQTGLTPEDVKNAVSGSMVVMKRSKSGEKPVDIAPMIKLVDVTKEGDALTMRVKLPASGSEYLNPSYIGDHFADKACVKRIVREEIIF
ncbi:MAG: DUF2344 domain-containing protein [Clostridia bacterium]|nr:DUF2344 domain-containing protein [Clostridia bacterium]